MYNLLIVLQKGPNKKFNNRWCCPFPVFTWNNTFIAYPKKLTKNRFAIVADEIEVCVGERNGQTDRQAMTEKDKV